MPSDSAIFNTIFLRDLVEYKWEYYVKKQFMFNALQYLFFLVCFTANAIIFMPNKMLPSPYIPY